MVWNHKPFDGFERICEKWNSLGDSGGKQTIEVYIYFFLLCWNPQNKNGKSQTIRGGGFSLGLCTKSCQQCLKYQNLSLPEK